MRITLLASALTLSLIGTPAIAGDVRELTQADCGTTITDNAVLIEDITCNTLNGLTVVGPAVLDLRRHTLSCVRSDNGIVLEGRGARLRNGEVTGCDTGPFLVGDGGHRVRKIDVDDANRVIRIRSDDNKLLLVHARGNSILSCCHD